MHKKDRKKNNKLYDINEFGGSPYVQAASHKDAFICEGHFIGFNQNPYTYAFNAMRHNR